MILHKQRQLWEIEGTIVSGTGGSYTATLYEEDYDLEQRNCEIFPKPEFTIILLNVALNADIAVETYQQARQNYVSILEECTCAPVMLRDEFDTWQDFQDETDSQGNPRYEHIIEVCEKLMRELLSMRYPGYNFAAWTPGEPYFPVAQLDADQYADK